MNVSVVLADSCLSRLVVYILFPARIGPCCLFVSWRVQLQQRQRSGNDDGDGGGLSRRLLRCRAVSSSCYCCRWLFLQSVACEDDRLCGEHRSIQIHSDSNTYITQCLRLTRWTKYSSIAPSNIASSISY